MPSALSANAVLVATYWMSYQRIDAAGSGNAVVGDAADINLDRAAYQVLMLIAPYLFGPGSIHVAHRDDEYVEVAELEAAVSSYERLVREIIGST